MKKIVCCLLAVLFLCAGCAKASFYENETALHTWMAQRTQGYTLLPTSRRMVLCSDKKGISLQIDTGTDGLPRLTVSDGKTYASATETDLLTVYAGETLYAKAEHTLSYYDPYRNAYTASMQVWQKDETHFRVFFIFAPDGTDFYPVPRLLTQEQYGQIFAEVKTYNAEQRALALNNGETPVDYEADFAALYAATAHPTLASDPDGKTVYQYTYVASEYLMIYRALFLRLPYSEQDWRRSFDALGYYGDRPDRVVLYADLAAEETARLTLYTSDPYLSSSRVTADTLRVEFCPGVREYAFVSVGEG